MSSRSVEDRLLSRIAVVESCWEWLGCRDRYGYGQMRVNGKRALAHRTSFAVFRGPIPAGLTLDHLCRNRGCVNPAHLEAVTNKENVLRGIGLTAVHARKTHCLHGHAFDEANTYRPSRGGRACRECQRVAWNRFDANRRKQRALSSGGICV